jgi:hemolysin activation/secretion protein
MEDAACIQRLPADLVTLIEPSIAQLRSQLHDRQGWDILFFAGHGSDLEAGTLHLNPDETISLNDVSHAVAAAIERLYLDRQYLTRGAYIPTGQTLAIDGAVVRIQIVEGKLEDIKVTGTQKLKPEYIRSRLALATSQPLNNDRLIEGLRLLQQDPLIGNITAELSSGIQPGTNLLEIKVTENPTFTSEIATNNNRPPSIGSWQRRGQISEANLTGWGDRVILAYSNIDGSNGIDVSYTVPLSPTQTTLSINLEGRVQLADRSLVVLEQFAVGGQTTVRGYRQDALLADNGAFASVELKLPIGKSEGSIFQVAPFIDVGTVWNNTNRANLGGNTLLSTGLGLQWRSNNLSARIDWGIPLVNATARKNSWQDNGLYFSLRYFP